MRGASLRLAARSDGAEELFQPLTAAFACTHDLKPRNTKTLFPPPRSVGPSRRRLQRPKSVSAASHVPDGEHLYGLTCAPPRGALLLWWPAAGVAILHVLRQTGVPLSSHWFSLLLSRYFMCLSWPTEVTVTIPPIVERRTYSSMAVVTKCLIHELCFSSTFGNE